MKKGFIHILAPLAIVFILSLGVFTTAATKRTAELNKSRVLSSSDDKGGRGDSGKSESHGGGGSESHGGGDSSNSNLSSSQNNSGNSSGSSQNKNAQSQPAVVPKNTAPAVAAPSEKPESETEIDVKKEAETKLPKDLSNVKFNLEKHGTRLVIKIKDEAGHETELGEKETEKVENELEKKDIKVATSSAGLVVTKNQTSATTNFPVSVDLATSQLQVTTPQGQQTLTVLPDQAVANILGNQISTASEVELTLENNTLAYKIKGLKDKRLFGIIPVTTAVETTVSAQNGQTLNTQQSLFDRVISLLSI